MRQKSFTNLRTLVNSAFGSVCSFALISLLDNDHSYLKSIGSIGRLRC